MNIIWIAWFGKLILNQSRLLDIKPGFGHAHIFAGGQCVQCGIVVNAFDGVIALGEEFDAVIF